MLPLLIASVALAGKPASTCETYDTDQTSLIYDLGISPSTLDGYTDNEVTAGLQADRTNADLVRIATARTLLWANTFAYRIDTTTGLVPDAAGTWRVTSVGSGKSQLDVVHWQDIDDQSWTLYYDDDGLCAVVYEN